MNSRPNIWALVPVKAFSAAKQRLSPVLNATDRARLARAMFEDVLDVLARCRQHFAGIIIVTSDDAAAALAEQHGCHVVSDRVRNGINAAIRLGLDHVLKNGGAGVLILPSDIPHVKCDAVARAVGTIKTPYSLAIIKAMDGGTNLLACGSARSLPLRFGPGSFRKHCEAAREQRLEVCALPSGELELDIDRPQDLTAFLALQSKTRTNALLTSLSSANRRYRTALPLDDFSDDRNLTLDEALRLTTLRDLDPLLRAASERRDRAHGALISYSRKVFIPLTRLCRDVCHYCTFARPPRNSCEHFSLEKKYWTLPMPVATRVARRHCSRLAINPSYAIAKPATSWRDLGIRARFRTSRRWLAWCLKKPAYCLTSTRGCSMLMISALFGEYQFRKA